MTAFSEQRANIRKALISAGIPDDSAARIANILGNSAQEMRHAGQVTHDTTPADMRYIDSATRKQRFPNIDPKEHDPDSTVPQRTPTSEDKPVPQKQPNVISTVIPQVEDQQFRVTGGSLTDVVGMGQTAAVHVRKTVAGMPPGGHPITMMDPQGNQLVGKAPRAQVGPNDGTSRLDIQENGREVLWNLQMLNRSDYDVVTDIQFVEGKGLQVTYDRIKAWDMNAQRSDLIDTVEQDVVTEIVEDNRGLRGRRRTIPAFTSLGSTNTFFNTFRIGHFTGGWDLGTTKTVTQEWPQGGADVDVINLTEIVPESDEERKVLFAVRTRDIVGAVGTPQEEQDRDDPRPVMKTPKFNANHEVIEEKDEPLVEYYAIAIQSLPASVDHPPCDAFIRLNKLKTSELEYFDPSIFQAVGHAPGEHPCIQWVGQRVTVVTGISLTSGGIGFSTQEVIVLAAGAVDGGTIPTTECPTS